MPITFDTLKVAIKHTLGGDPSAGASYARIINGAGRAWSTAQDWYYLGDRLATLTATPNVEWVALPDDYQSFNSLVPVGDGYATLAMVSPSQFVEIAENGILGNVSSYIATIQYRDVLTDVAPWLRLYPTPSIADQFTLVYDAQWADVNEDEDVIPVPKFAEHAFEEWVRMYARGMDEEDSEPLAVRMAALKASPLFLDVARRDALVTGAVVIPGRGAAQESYGSYTRRNHPNNLS
jgi:hypothetical protein